MKKISWSKIIPKIDNLLQEKLPDFYNHDSTIRLDSLAVSRGQPDICLIYADVYNEIVFEYFELNSIDAEKILKTRLIDCFQQIKERAEDAIKQIKEKI